MVGDREGLRSHHPDFEGARFLMVWTGNSSLNEYIDLLSLSVMLTVAVGAKMSKPSMFPPEIICPKNLSVPSTNRSLVIGTSICVSVDPGGNMIGMALARVYPM